MRSIRQEVLERFPLRTGGRGADEEFADALYAMLRSIDDLCVTVDGWTFFRVVQESADSVDVVGLMVLLPGGSVPIAISLRSAERGLDWSLQIGRQDGVWLSLSDSKRWNSVYLYASGDRHSPPWIWDRTYQGSVLRAVS
jgi:hypothetical protein